ncbi:MAG: aspartate aminotransferase family protein [Clostridia bacterium]|nr:aspartate aminotransferase family protein [Clostridia bacterium]
MSIEVMIQDGESYLMNNYKRLPISFVKGEGMKLLDTEGKEYIDFLGGIAVNSLGHSPHVVVEALKDQIGKLMHVSNYFWIDSQVELGKILAHNSFGDKVFLCNSGAEANEAAIKLARKYAYKKYGSHRNEVIAMTGSFHGRTLATLSITDSKKYQEGYGPLPEGFKMASFNDIDALKNIVGDNTCAIILEPIQGEGGVTAAKAEYLKEVKKLCLEKDILLIFDEIQCGIARTGKLFAYEHYNVEPDIMSLAKALAAGFPIGAVVATDKVAVAWQPGDHGSTFGGNPLACTAAVATMKEVVEKKLWMRAEMVGSYFGQQLQLLVNQYPFVKELKGKGLMLGLELEMEGASIVAKAFEKGFIINCTAGKVLRFVPPLIVTEEDIDGLMVVLKEIFNEMEVVE